MWGDFIGLLWFDILRIRRQVALDNLAIAFPQMSFCERKSLARRSLKNLGRGFIDFLCLPYIDEKWVGENVVYEGVENWEKAQKKNRGVLLLGLHLGVGDIGIASLSLKKIPISLITKTFTTRWVQEFWQYYRGRFSTEFINDRKSSFQVLKALKKQRGVIFVLDQFHGHPIGIQSRFFGKPTGTAYGLSLFAYKTKAPVVPLYMYKGKDHKFHVVFEPEVIFEDQGEKEKTFSYMTQKYDKVLEGIITQFPEQWLWVHRRWKELDRLKERLN